MQARDGRGAVKVECWPDPGLTVKGGLARLTKTWVWAKQERSHGRHKDLGLGLWAVGMLGGIIGIPTVFPGLLMLSHRCSTSCTKPSKADARVMPVPLLSMCG